MKHAMIKLSVFMHLTVKTLLMKQLGGTQEYMW